MKRGEEKGIRVGQNSAEVVIIGAGIMGCAIAYSLAERGVRDIVVVEKDAIARGATADAAGGIRQQFSTVTNVQLATYSVRVGKRMPSDSASTTICISRDISSYSMTPPRKRPSARIWRFKQRLGVPSRWVSPAEIAELNPYITLDDVIGGTFCPEDGWVDTYNSTMGYAQAARRLGVTFQEETEVTGITVEQSKITSVSTTDGAISNAVGDHLRRTADPVGRPNGWC